jgi:hypothetical protein
MLYSLNGLGIFISMNLLGYCIDGSDNDSYMNPDMYETNICQCYDYVKNRRLHLNPEFRLVRKSYDISSTFDCFTIVSSRFRDFCVSQGYSGVSFYPIPNYSGKFYFDVHQMVAFDAIRRKTRFLELNNECKEYNEVVGANPVCLLDNKPLSDGFFRTDIEFGRSYAKSPLILVGVETGVKLRAGKFKGLYLEKILDTYSWEKTENQ